MIEKISNGIIPVLADRIIMQSEISSCKTDSRNIISRSLTIAPFNTIISSPLMTPEIGRCVFDTIILLNMFNCIYNRLLLYMSRAFTVIHGNTSFFYAANIAAQFILSFTIFYQLCFNRKSPHNLQMTPA